MTLKKCRKSLFFSIFTLAIALGIGAYWAVPAMAAGTQAGAPPAVSAAAPDFELPDLNGSNVTLSQFKGKEPVLLYFWASWCPYCMAVRPNVINLRNQVPKGDLEILGINVGGGDSLARVKRFEEAHPAPYTVLYDGEGKAVRAYQVQGIPLFVLIDKNGNVKFRGNEFPANAMELLKQ